jgi:hypothetical protein
VRLAPAVAVAWAALGAAAAEAGRRESALGHCLQLQRQNAAAWAALGRLYLHHGAPGAAAVALEQVHPLLRFKEPPSLFKFRNNAQSAAQLAASISHVAPIWA